MRQDTIDFAGVFHFGDWERTCGTPPVTFKPGFRYVQTFEAEKTPEAEKGFVESIKGWFSDLFADEKEKVAKAAWAKLGAKTEGAIAITPAVSIIVDECVDGKRKVALRCYLHVDIWYGATAKADAGSGKVAAASFFELTLPKAISLVECGTCPCDETKMTMLLFPGLYDGAVHLATRGWPDITLADAGHDVEAQPLMAIATPVEGPTLAATEDAPPNAAKVSTKHRKGS